MTRPKVSARPRPFKRPRLRVAVDWDGTLVGLAAAGFGELEVLPKAQADVYVDDRALRCEGSWPAALDALTTIEVRELRRRAGVRL